MNNEIMHKTNKGKRLSPLQAIKRYCRYQCCCNDTKSWKDCTLTNCFLYNYRFGRNPYHLLAKNSSVKRMGENLVKFKKKHFLEATSKVQTPQLNSFLDPGLKQDLGQASIQTKLSGGDL